MARPRREHQGRVFDVQPSADDRALAYPVRPLLASFVAPRRKVWRPGVVIDQGREGACVGHGWANELTGSPVRVRFRSPLIPAGVPRDAQGFAFWLYHRAQEVDEFPGVDYSGTSVGAAAGVVRDMGFISGYRWCQTRADFTQTLQQVGPVVIAIPWLSGMYEAPGGRLVPSGDQVGYHCLLANGYDPDLFPEPGEAPREMVRLVNSWGPDWGVRGQAWIDLSDLWPLLSDEGADMCVPLGRSLLRRVAAAVTR